METESDAWKIFNRDTEAGRLLSRLYGVAPSGKVSYPKHRRRRRAKESDSDDCRSWKTTGVVHGWSKAAETEKEEERKANIARALSLAVPKVGRGSQRHSGGTMRETESLKIDLVPRRKTEVASRQTVEETLQKKRQYRPPAARNVEDEKKKLQGAISIAPTPRSTSLSSGAVRPSTLFDQLFQEIKERRQHQMEMEAIGAGEATRESIAYEIKERIEHLKRLDPKRALTVVQRLHSKS